MGQPLFWQYKGKLYLVSRFDSQTKDRQTGKWYKAVTYHPVNDPEITYNRETKDFFSKFQEVNILDAYKTIQSIDIPIDPL